MRSVRRVWTRTSGTGARAVVVAVLVVAVAACGGGEDAAAEAPPTSDDGGEQTSSPTTPGTGAEPVTSAATTQAPTTAAPTTTSTLPPTPLTLAFAGDTYGLGLEGDVAAGMAERLAPMRPVLDAADLAVLNLETAITDAG